MIEFVPNDEKLLFSEEFEAKIYRCQCTKCHRRFFYKKDRENHRKKSHNYPCQNCSLKFTTQRLLDDHQKMHS